MDDSPDCDDRLLEEDFPAFWERLLQVRDQDRDEFERLFQKLVDRWSPFLYAIANQTTDDASRVLHGVSGVCQDVWLRVTGALSQFGNAPDRHRSLGEFKKWVREILRNVIAGAHRYQKKHGPDAGNHASPADLLERQDGSEGVQQRVETNDELARLNAILATLPQKDRELLALWQEVGTYAAVAQRKGISEYEAKRDIQRIFAQVQLLWNTP